MAACAQRKLKSVSGTAVYRRRQPERSVVYQVLQDHLETWLAGCRQADEEGSQVATYIEQDFRKYLDCGILAHGFARARCAGCGYTISSPILVKGAASAPLVMPGGWWKPLPIWLIMFSPKSLCVSGSCSFPNGFGIFWPEMLNAISVFFSNKTNRKPPKMILT